MSDTPVKTPLVEMLRSIPADACDNYDVSPFMSHHVPYGRHFHDAADEIEALERERDEWKAKAEANERDAERWRQFMSSVSYWREPLVNATTGEEVRDECLYRISWRGRPFATLENSVDAARSAEKEKSDK